MKIYGLATALSQTAQEKLDNKFNLMKTTVVYDSDSKTIEALHSPEKEEFGIHSKHGIKAMAESLLKTVKEVIELQNAANFKFGTNIKAPVIFGAAEDFHQGRLDSVVDMLPKTRSDLSYKHQSYPIVKYANKMSEYLQDNRVAKTSYESFRRTAEVNLEKLHSGYSREELEEVVPTESLSDEKIEQLASSMFYRVSGLHFKYNSETSVSSFILIALPTKPVKTASSSEFAEKKQMLSDLKALELSRENKRRFGIAFMRAMLAFGFTEQLKQPITIKTPFAKASRYFYDVVSTEIAKTAALQDTTLKGTMLNDFVYVPETVANLRD